MKIQIYADGADYDGILRAAANPRISGFTTNPTLMRKSGVKDYATFARSILKELKDRRPDTNISLEVFADDVVGMIDQGMAIHRWALEVGYRAFVKVPITNTANILSTEVIHYLTQRGVPVNITAVFTPEQVAAVLSSLTPTTPTIISVFAGRIADVGVDPKRIMRECIAETKTSDLHRFGSIYETHNIKFLWASPREVYNLIDADECGADIITMTNDLIAKMDNFGKTLDQYSLETVKMFYKDAKDSGYTIDMSKEVL